MGGAVSDENGQFGLKDAVQEYLDRGWPVVRLKTGTKEAFQRSWNKLDLAAEDFQLGENVGVRFGPDSGGLVDVDLDYETARKLAARPIFGLSHLREFGRQSLQGGQRGHRLVIVPDAPNRSRVFGIRSRQAVEALKARGHKLTILEIRGSSGSQTAFPPSVIFKDGKRDALVWSNAHAEIPEVGWAELHRRAGILAVASLAAAVFPTDEKQLPFLIALYGTLIEAGVCGDDARQIAAEVSSLSGGADCGDLTWQRADESLPEMLNIVGLQSLEISVRGWLSMRDDADRRTDTHLQDAEYRQDNARPGTIDALTLGEILDHLDPSAFADYESHRRVLHASHHATAGDKSARELFVAWCARNADFGPGKRDEHGKLWSDVVRAMWDRTPLQRDGGAPMNTVGTLIAHLREAGENGLASEIAGLSNSGLDDFAPLDPGYLEEDSFEEAHRINPRKHYSIMDLMGLPDPVWVVEGLLLERSLAVIFGQPKSFKSFIALDLALCIASGRPFHGATVVRGRACYVAAEGHAAETRDRVLAWCAENSVEPESLTDWFRLVVSGIRLDDAKSVKEFLKGAPLDYDVFVFDTLNRNMAGNESDTKDMTVVVAGCDMVRREMQAMVIVVHHSGVDKTRERGSTALRGAADTVLKVARQNRSVTLHLEAQRAGPDGGKLQFEAATMPVGDFENMRDSVVLRLTDGHQGYQNDLAPRYALLLEIVKAKPKRQADLVSPKVKGRAQSSVSEHVKALIGEGLLSEGTVTPTDAGLKFAMNHRKKED